MAYLVTYEGVSAELPIFKGKEIPCRAGVARHESYRPNGNVAQLQQFLRYNDGTHGICA